MTQCRYPLYCLYSLLTATYRTTSQNDADTHNHNNLSSEQNTTNRKGEEWEGNKEVEMEEEKDEEEEGLEKGMWEEEEEEEESEEEEEEEEEEGEEEEEEEEEVEKGEVEEEYQGGERVTCSATTTTKQLQGDLQSSAISVRNRSDSRVAAMSESLDANKRGTSPRIVSITPDLPLSATPPSSRQSVLRRRSTLRKKESKSTNPLSMIADETPHAVVALLREMDGNQTRLVLSQDTTSTLKAEAEKQGKCVWLINIMYMNKWNDVTGC